MKKSIEQKYTSLSEREHILSRPGMWVGSIKDEVRQSFVFDHDEHKMIIKDVTFSPAMLKLFDEVLSNSCDEYRRKDNLGLNSVDVVIDQTKNVISIKDNGGIPVVKHKEAKMYVPEFIFGQLRTSSNYDDSEDRNVIGTNGVGSVCTNIFSTKFIVETCDKKNKITIEWNDNMSKKSISDVTKTKEHYTKVTFNIDFNRFDQEVNGLTDDFISILEKRCIDAAAANPGLKVTTSIIYKDKSHHSDKEWKFKKFEEYMDLYSDFYDKSCVLSYKDEYKQFWICPDSSIDVAFVNGAECSKGTHIKAIRQPIGHAVSDTLKKKHKIDVTNKGIDNKYGIFAILDVSNPSYNSQTKEELTNSIDSFYKDKSIKFEISDKFLKQVSKSEIVQLVVDWYKKKVEAEDQAKIRKLNREAKTQLKRPDKYVTCSSKKKKERQLWIFEGDSASAGFRVGRNPELQAGYIMRGVPKNSYGLSPISIMKNEVYNDLVSILGLQWGKEFDIDKLNFGKIVISSDADVDGDHIGGLLLLWASNWPELFEKKIICRSISPIIIATKGKDEKKYYKMSDYKAEEKKLKGYQIKYTKGLAGLNAKQSKAMYQEPIFQYYTQDDLTGINFKKWFAKENADERKVILTKS